MKLLDFIKNREGQRPAAEQQSQQQKPDVGREAAGRHTAEPDAPSKTLSQLPEDIQSRARDIGSRVQQTGENIEQGASLPQTPAEPTGNQEPQRQMMAAQENPAPGLSPTSMQSGVPVKDVEGPGAPEPTPNTVARRPPSWER